MAESSSRSKGSVNERRRASLKIESGIAELVADLCIVTGRPRSELIEEPYIWLLILHRAAMRSEAVRNLRDIAAIGAAVAPLASEKNADGSAKLRKQLEKEANGQ